MNLSLVIPLFDEEGNVERLLRDVPASLARNPLLSAFELLCVDDGSRDGTGEMLQRRRTPETTILRFRENRGKSAALATGFAAARHDLVGFMDGDLQTTPDDLQAMLKGIRGGLDGATGRWVHRNDPWIRRASSALARGARHAILHDGIRDITCPLQVYRRECLAGVPTFEGFHRFIPHLVAIQGYEVGQFPVRHFPRAAGTSKYGIGNRLGVGIRNLLHVRRLTRRARKAG